MRILRFLCLMLLTTPLLVACNRNEHASRMHGHVDKLEVIDRSVGTGIEARPGMKVTVAYSGWLYDDRKADFHGSAFDSSSDHGGPYAFVLGEGRVIAGWDRGVTGMHVGGTRTLIIPAALAYGSRGAGGVIPPDATLVFNVKLVSAQAQ